MCVPSDHIGVTPGPLLPPVPLLRHTDQPLHFLRSLNPAGRNVEAFVGTDRPVLVRRGRTGRYTWEVPCLSVHTSAGLGRRNPFVYSHPRGHWLGQRSDYKHTFWKSSGSQWSHLPQAIDENREGKPSS